MRQSIDSIRGKASQITAAALRRFAMAECGWHKPEPTVRVNDAPPGVEAQVDFAKMGLVRDAETASEEEPSVFGKRCKRRPVTASQRHT